MERLTLLSVLQLYITAAAAVFGDSVTAKRHHPVTLPCDSTCPGSLTWTLLRNHGGVRARCDQTSCSAVEGFMTSHDQYLKGNPHLTLTSADYSMRGTYTCECDGREVRRVRVFIETEEITREITPGDPIDVYVPLTDLVEVRFISSETTHPSHLQICTVDHENIHCHPDYSERVTGYNTLRIKRSRVTDSGTYTVWDAENEETLATVNITVREEKPPYPYGKQESSVPVWVIVMLVILLMVAVVVILYERNQIQKLHGQVVNTHTHTHTPPQTDVSSNQQLIMMNVYSGHSTGHEDISVL